MQLSNEADKPPKSASSSVHNSHSAYREKLLEHLFVGELLRYLWRNDVMDVEFLRPEVDSGGFDLVIAYMRTIRHIQLKSSHCDSATACQKVNVRLAQKQSGCVVWMQFHPDTLALGPFLWFGGGPGEPIPDLSQFPLGKHTKGNSKGIKLERPSIRVIPRAAFRELNSIGDVVYALFGVFEPLALPSYNKQPKRERVDRRPAVTARQTIEYEKEYLEYLRTHGVKGGSLSSYLSNLRSASRIGGFEVSPQKLHSEDCVRHMIERLKERMPHARLRNCTAAFRQYVSMVKDLGLQPTGQ